MAISNNYIPGTVPAQTSAAMRTFLDNEFYRISLLLNELAQQGQYGGLLSITDTVLSITTTPQKLPYDLGLPSTGIVPEPATNEFVISASGDYLLAMFIDYESTQSIELTITPHINDLPAGLGIGVTSEVLSNSFFKDIGAATIFRAEAGDRISLYASGDRARTITIKQRNFYAVRL